MSVLAAEESRNKETLNTLVQAKVTPTETPTAAAGATNATAKPIPSEVKVPATTVKLSSILKK